MDPRKLPYPIEYQNGCWVWRGPRNHGGYGRVHLRGKRYRAHRVLWQGLNGPVPEGFEVLHRCDNRSCINPDHLFLGTAADNNHDMVAKGRQVRGEAVGTRRLTESQVLDVLERLRSGESHKAISERYAVHPGTISKIACRTRWRHLKGESLKRGYPRWRNVRLVGER